MSNLGAVLDIAKTALAAQQYGMDVTAHNIANVNTPGYSRQTVVYASKTPSQFGGLQIGRGVDTVEIIRSSDQFLEDQLMHQRANLLSSREMENYMQILEGLFDENGEISMSQMLADFWNRWQDVANNPTGASERIALYEHSVLLADQFATLDSDLTQMETDITRAVGVAIDKINEIASQIAELNVQISETEAGSVSNDLRDHRNSLVSELSEYIPVKTFEQGNGSLSVVTSRGCILVHESSSYRLELGGTHGDRVRWLGSGGAVADITDQITEGKLAGYLDMRDEIIAKYKLDLNAMVEEFIWAVNQQHSQGVGLKLFEPGISLSGTYQTGTDLGDLHFGQRIQFVADGLKIWIEDRTDPANPVMNSVSIDLSGLNTSSTLADLATAINSQITTAGLSGVTADGSGDRLVFTADNNHAFGFSDDNSNILAAIGVNTFFKGVGAGSIGVNSVLEDKDYMAAALIESDGRFASGDNRNALSVADLQYASMEIAQWTCDRAEGRTKGSSTATIEDYYHGMVGSIGVVSASISSSKTFREAMVNRLSEVRDSVSAVSLDEEMTNLIKFQHAYSAAAKLISISDEMLQTLLSAR